MTWSCPYVSYYVKFVNLCNSFETFLVIVWCFSVNSLALLLRTTVIVLFVLVFLWDFSGGGDISSHSRIFHSYDDVTITSEGLQMLTFNWHLWPLSSEDSLVCHTNCDRLQWSSTRTRDPHICYRAFGREAVTICFSTYVFQAGIRKTELSHASRTL